MITVRDNRILVQNLYSVILAALPAVMALRIPGINKGLATVLLVLSAPYPLWRICVERNFRGCCFFLLFLVWALVRSLDSPMQCVCLFLVLLHCLGVQNGTLNYSLFWKTVVTLAIFSSAVVMIQCLLYYLFGIPTYLLTESLLLEDNIYYIERFFSTLEAEGLFRPCAFFLEPSHFAQYSIVALISVLFPNEGSPRWWKPIFIAAGCILTTSGMGIALVFGAFCWYFFFSKRERYTRLPLIVCLGALGMILVLLLMQLPFFSGAMNRVFGTESNGYNAVAGRMGSWFKYVYPLKGPELLFGTGFREEYEIYAASTVRLMNGYGILGFLLYLGMIFSFGNREKNPRKSFLLCDHLALLFVSNLTGMISMCFWLPLFLARKPKAESPGNEKEASLEAKTNSLS